MNFTDRACEFKPKSDFHNYFYISLRNRYVYLAIGKAANSTVKHILYGLEHTGTRFKTKSVHERQSSPLLSPFQLPEDMLEQVFTGDDYFRFSIVRNPYTRLLSCFLDRIQSASSAPNRILVRLLGKPEGYKPTFAEFIRAICTQSPYEQNIHWRLQTAELCTPLINYHMIGKQENFAADMTQVWQRIAPGVVPPDFGATNKAPSITRAGSRLADFYTPELVERVKNTYAEDFMTFGYSTELP